MNRTRWKLLGLCLILLCGVVLAVFVWRDHEPSAASASDCGVVAELAREFVAMNGQDQTGGDTSASFAVKIRAAAESVSEPQLKSDLDRWADGFADLADIQRRDADHPPSTPGGNEHVTRAGDTIYGTADELQRWCPQAWPTSG
ncbi:hypothetical protein NGTWS0302_26000 [Mycolicibacterium cyprinidarum]|uniref:Uncharacterized protein n=1 Tax=Mycolicibacterium cyprinidarum TaxID=2860311 RepID=A0ABQ4VCQ3_9MYCO|nr:hypothetical protein NGTWS1803_13240 [Mycolicibacterium sp. NGTWS1803]GJF10333.1 hypothetical protein NGTWS0302_26000 [Mycolicibacterium sp. NGTWS0302]GJF18207.1 hypothetical protein NGTWS1702_25820 [Mycolicibacterium sp. NGTWSNA01]